MKIKSEVRSQESGVRRLIEQQNNRAVEQQSKGKNSAALLRYCATALILLFTAYCLLSTIGYSYASNHQIGQIRQITNIEIMDNAVKIEADGPIKYKISRPADPFRVVVEMEGIGAGKFTEKIFSYKAGITEITPSQIESPSLSTMLDILLHAPMSVRPEISGNTLVLHIEQPAAATGDIPIADRHAASEIIAVLFYEVGEGAELVIKGDGIMPEPAVFEIDGRMFIDMSNLKMEATLPDNIKSPLKDIVYREEKDRIRMILNIEDRASSDVFVLDDEIVVSLAFKDREAVIKKKDAVVKNDIRQLDAANAGIVSLDFQDANIVAIIRLLGEVSGYNVVIHPDVQGKISMRLLNVPWHQALDVILKTFNLKKIVEGNVMRVVTLKAFLEEKEAIAKTKEVFGKVEDIETRVFIVNYANVDKVRESIDKAKALSPRGSISTDVRTRSLIVKDIPSSIDGIKKLIETLDKQTPQVLIEARIVEMNTHFARELGVEWGFQHRPRVEARNFTVRGGLGTDITGGQNPGFGLFNLPVTVPTSAVTIGYLNAAQTFGLDLRLSAAETIGKAKIISSPKIMTIENEKAEIIHGTQIPVVTPGTADRPPTVTYRDAALKLVVTPSVTSEETLFLDIEIANDVPDFRPGRAILGNVPIDKREAKNKVLVKNGETVVIGGILKTREDEGEDRVPGLSKIPILGWLFKKELKKTESQEMLIFITPKIIRQ